MAQKMKLSHHREEGKSHTGPALPSNGSQGVETLVLAARDRKTLHLFPEVLDL